MSMRLTTGLFNPDTRLDTRGTHNIPVSTRSTRYLPLTRLLLRPARIEKSKVFFLILIFGIPSVSYDRS